MTLRLSWPKDGRQVSKLQINNTAMRNRHNFITFSLILLLTTELPATNFTWYPPSGQSADRKTLQNPLPRRPWRSAPTCRAALETFSLSPGLELIPESACWLPLLFPFPVGVAILRQPGYSQGFRRPLAHPWSRHPHKSPAV